MKKVLITGANSYIGMSFEKYVNNDENIIVDTLDMLDEGWNKYDFSKYDTVLHLAAIVHLKEKKSMIDLYNKVNYELAVNVAQKAKEAGVKQFIFMSSMSVYGIETGEIDINTIPNPKSMYAKTKLQAEKEISKLSSDSFQIVVVRPPLVYGEGCKGNYSRLIKLADKLPIFPTYRNKRSMISIENLCAFFKDVIINEKEGLFLPQDDEYVCTIDMMKKMRNRKVHSTCLFNWLIWILVKINGTFKKVFGNLIYKK